MRISAAGPQGLEPVAAPQAGARESGSHEPSVIPIASRKCFDGEGLPQTPSSPAEASVESGGGGAAELPRLTDA
jgi:hypothetical protein